MCTTQYEIEIVAKAHVVFKCEVVHLRLPFCD